jgi:hypothetical protein
VTAATAVTWVRTSGPMRIAGTAHGQGIASRTSRWRAVTSLLWARRSLQSFEPLEPVRRVAVRYAARRAGPPIVFTFGNLDVSGSRRQAGWTRAGVSGRGAIRP